MAVCFGRYNDVEKVEYEGCVLNLWERNGSWDSDWYATVWDEGLGKVLDVCYDTTRAGSNGSWAKIDATNDAIRKAYRYFFNAEREEFDTYINNYCAKAVHVGDAVTVVRGRKVPIGTKGVVFWIGSVYNQYARCAENRVGLDANGEKIFLCTDYVEVDNWERKLIHGKARKEWIQKGAIRKIPDWARECLKEVR